MKKSIDVHILYYKKKEKKKTKTTEQRYALADGLISFCRI